MGPEIFSHCSILFQSLFWTSFLLRLSSTLDQRTIFPLCFFFSFSFEKNLVQCWFILLALELCLFPLKLFFSTNFWVTARTHTSIDHCLWVCSLQRGVVCCGWDLREPLSPSCRWGARYGEHWQGQTPVPHLYPPLEASHLPGLAALLEPVKLVTCSLHSLGQG